MLRPQDSEQYAWDDLSLPRKLVVRIVGKFLSPFSRVIALLIDVLCCELLPLPQNIRRAFLCWSLILNFDQQYIINYRDWECVNGTVGFVLQNSFISYICILIL